MPHNFAFPPSFCLEAQTPFTYKYIRTHTHETGQKRIKAPPHFAWRTWSGKARPLIFSKKKSCAPVKKEKAPPAPLKTLILAPFAPSYVLPLPPLASSCLLLLFNREYKSQALIIAPPSSQARPTSAVLASPPMHAREEIERGAKERRQGRRREGRA